MHKIVNLTLTFIYDLDLRMTLTFEYVLMEYKHIEVNFLPAYADGNLQSNPPA